MHNSPLKILMVASEATPFAKTGGLADVIGSLPMALQRLGHEVKVVLPWYRETKEKLGGLPRMRKRLSVGLGGMTCDLQVRAQQQNAIPVYFLDYPAYFDRAGLYGEQGSDYPDNAERFGLLSRAALEMARQIGFAPNLVHAHDWQAGLVPVFLRQNYWRDPFFAKTASLFTIHNLGYQGRFSLDTLALLGLDTSLGHVGALEYHGSISLLKGGILYADYISTVSPTYCREIQTNEFGMGMDGLLCSRSKHLYGILNGIDPDYWNPLKDPALVHPYGIQDLKGKQNCKMALQRQLGLPVDAGCPIIAMVTRLDPQKGLDLLLESWERVLALPVQLVVLGTGQKDYERRLSEAAAFYPDRARVLLQFDDTLSRRIYAGSDLFLMPSRYEPCGLGQLIALRYGCVPVVHATGGLADTVVDPEVNLEAANGFSFRSYRRKELLHALERALACYQDHNQWRSLQTRGMHQDLSWDKAAQEYVNLYSRCIEEKV